MRIFLAIFLLALMVTAVSTPWIRRLAIGLGFVDAPAQRKLHSTPMPLLGGLAIFGGAIAAVLIFAGQLARSVSGVLLASSLVALVGLLDDRYGLPAWAKLGGQLLGTAVLVLFGIHVQLPIPDVANYAITFLWVALISNGINFLDNMDGLSAGVSGVAASFIMLLGLQNGQFLVSGLAAAVLGATIGFLRYNFKPARIFMGDVGALFLGFLLAVLALQLRFPDNSNSVTWMVPLFILGTPIFDTSLVVISRLRRRVSPNTAGKDHTSHRLVRHGFSQREAVLLLYLLSGIFGMIAIFLTQATVLEAYVVATLVALTALYGILRLEQWLQID